MRIVGDEYKDQDFKEVSNVKMKELNYTLIKEIIGFRARAEERGTSERIE